jgi:hypothetical protein
MSGKLMPSKRNVFQWQATGRSVCGATHRRSGLPLQDAIRWLPGCGIGPSVALAIADGHGSTPSFRSDTGAALAVETATAVMEDFRQLNSRLRLQDIARLRTTVKEEIPRELVGKWRVAVRHHLDENPFSSRALEQVDTAGCSARREVETNPFLAYGSTLLGALLTNVFLLYFQLGDGDILLVSEAGEVTQPWPRDKRLLGVETTSLCIPDSWSDVRIGFHPASYHSLALMLLSTDGYANSFREERGFLRVGRDILKIIQSYGMQRV